MISRVFWSVRPHASDCWLALDSISMFNNLILFVFYRRDNSDVLFAVNLCIRRSRCLVVTLIARSASAARWIIKGSALPAVFL